MDVTERPFPLPTNTHALTDTQSLNRDVLSINLRWLTSSESSCPEAANCELIREKVGVLHQFLDGEMAFLVKLLYSTDVRKLEGSHLGIEGRRPSSKRDDLA